MSLNANTKCPESVVNVHIFNIKDVHIQLTTMVDTLPISGRTGQRRFLAVDNSEYRVMI